MVPIPNLLIDRAAPGRLADKLAKAKAKEKDKAERAKAKRDREIAAANARIAQAHQKKVKKVAKAQSRTQSVRSGVIQRGTKRIAAIKDLEAELAAERADLERVVNDA